MDTATHLEVKLMSAKKALNLYEYDKPISKRDVYFYEADRVIPLITRNCLVVGFERTIAGRSVSFEKVRSSKTISVSLADLGGDVQGELEEDTTE